MIKLVQTSGTYIGRSKGTDRWTWSADLEGLPAELNEIDSVTYLLHESYAEREVTMKAPATAISMASTGTFNLMAILTLKSGTQVELGWLPLKLYYPKHESTRVYDEDFVDPRAN